METQALQTGQSRKPQGLCTGCPLCLECPFPQILAELPIPSWGWLRHQPLRQLVSPFLLVPLLSNCLSTLTASRLVPGNLGSERVTFSKETELTQSCWVVPKAGEVGRDSLLGMCRVWQVALLLMTGHTVLCHCRRLRETVSSVWKMQTPKGTNPGLVVWACPLLFERLR